MSFEEHIKAGLFSSMADCLDTRNKTAGAYHEIQR